MRLLNMRVGLAALSASLALACRKDPEPTARGDRVELTTEVVPQVCRGTVEFIDDELARIEAELGLGPATEPVELYVVDQDHIGEYCEPGQRACVLHSPRRLYVSADVYETVIRYELVRERLAQTSIGATKPVFLEGTAGALTWPSCEPMDDWQPPSTTKVLAANTRSQLGSAGRYLGGELIRWLLDTRGPAQVLELMADVDRTNNSSEVRVAYLERFGSSIDQDLWAHWRPDDAPVNLGRAGCVGVEPALGDVGSRLRLEAEFDCDSPRVRNDFQDPSRVYVEWVLDVPDSRAGVWALLDPLPEGVTLTLVNCKCKQESWSLPFWYDPESPWIEDGDVDRWMDEPTRLRVYAPIGSKVDIQLQMPCDPDAQDCPSGQQCTQYGDCLDETDDPAQLGEPCSPALGYDKAPLPCDAGLVCLGPYLGEGVCTPACATDCPGELTCFEGLGCTSACDPLAPSCADGDSCIADFSSGGGSCIPATADLGLLEPCDFFDFSCAPGLTCQKVVDIEGCHDAESWFDFSGCCTPLCDPSAPDPGCPPELPYCLVDDKHVLGSCQLSEPP